MKNRAEMSVVELTRRKKFWSQKQLSEAAGVSPSSACLAELGHPVRRKNAMKICDALGITFKASGIRLCSWDKKRVACQE